VSIPELGARVAGWAEPLGYTSSNATPDSCVVASRGGETRFYVRVRGNDVVVTSADRSEPERFEMSTRTETDVEKFLVAQVGRSLRQKLLPGSFALIIPSEAEHIAAPFALEPANDDPRQAIVLEDGTYRARFPWFNEPRAAVLFTHYANVSVGALKASYLDTTGDGLFSLDPGRLSSGHRVAQ
jgi:hypothetical protein